MITFPASPAVGQQFQTWTWDGVKWAPTPVMSSPCCGYLQIVGASPSQSLVFLPRNGDLIRINGLNYHIPAAGVTTGPSNCFVNGVAGSSVAVGVYRVYAFIHPTLGMQLDFSATAHATSTTPGNIGTEIKSGDDTRTLVGIVQTSGTAPASNSFYDNPQYRYTRSWFNRRPVSVMVAGGGVFAAAAWVAQTAGGYIAFQDEPLNVTGTWFGTANVWANVGISFQVNAAWGGAGGNTSTPGTTAAYENCTAILSLHLTEGIANLTLFANITSGNASGGCGFSGTLG